MLDLVPVTFREANAFVEQHHRHHGKVVGHKFSIAAADTETGCMVCIEPTRNMSFSLTSAM